MEKQQVSTFLKILQIPSNADPEEIKKSLLESGWNEKDADEAVAVLYPSYHTDGDKAAFTPKQASQIVAQKYVKPTPTQPAEPVVTSTSDSASQAFADLPDFTPHTSFDSVSTTAEATTESEDVSPSTLAPEQPVSESDSDSSIDIQPVTTPSVPEAPEQSVPGATEAAPDPEVPPLVPIPDDLDPEAEKNRPHTDAPWLQQQADIYDVSEEEKQRMIRTVYRTNERLSPQTIHALLGIDVDLSEYEAAYEQRHQDMGTDWVQISIIILSSLAIASVALFLGLYYFEVGPFHPTITGN